VLPYARAEAQPFPEAVLRTATSVSVDFSSNDHLPSIDGRLYAFPTVAGASMPLRGYNALIDQRRRILANSSVRGVVLKGPAIPGLGLSRDDCRESGSMMSAPSSCTPPPFDDVDRIELSWRDGSGTFFALGDEMNRVAGPRAAPTLMAGANGAPSAHSLYAPGGELRFVSGPAVPYEPPPRWSTLTAPPQGEGTGYLIDEMVLVPGPGAASTAFAPVIEPYEHVTAILLGGSDSLYFRLPSSTNPQSLAVWYPAGTNPSSLTAYARCGLPPTQGGGWDIRQGAADSGPGAADPLFIDLPPERPDGRTCLFGWHVTLVADEAAPFAVHFTVGQHFASTEWPELVVGTEFATSGATEEDAIRFAMRAAAWKFYGVSGGTHFVRSFRYTFGTCAGANICWRNRPDSCAANDCMAATGTCASTGTPCSIRCPADSGFTHPSGTFPVQTVDICAVPTGAATHVALIAHELGHFLSPTITLLGDEYWRSNDFDRICGISGRLIMRCSHSLMTYTWNPNINSLCTDRTHDGVTDLFLETATPGSFQPRYAIDGPHSVHECASGDTHLGAPHGASGWAQLSAHTPYPHPPWSPTNYGYMDFASSAARQEIGRNR
jgi:hypothetical protein